MESYENNHHAQLELVRRITAAKPEERIARWSHLCNSVQQVIVAGIRSRYPKAGQEEVKKRYVAQVYGAQWSIQWFNWDPKKEGY